MDTLTVSKQAFAECQQHSNPSVSSINHWRWNFHINWML